MRVLLGPTISSQLWSRHLELLALKPWTCLQRLEEESMQSHMRPSRGRFWFSRCLWLCSVAMLPWCWGPWGPFPQDTHNYTVMTFGSKLLSRFFCTYNVYTFVIDFTCMSLLLLYWSILYTGGWFNSIVQLAWVMGAIHIYECYPCHQYMYWWVQYTLPYREAVGDSIL